MNLDTFKIAIAVLGVVYVLLVFTTPAQPAKQTFTFDLAEIVCMALSLACFYAVMQKTLTGARVDHNLLKLERHCIFYAILGIICHILSATSTWVT